VKPEDPFERAKLPLVIAAVGIAGGLAIAGSVERTVGGAAVVAAWVLGVAALHRLGRAGSAPREPEPVSDLGAKDDDPDVGT
jgi:hypothetical protein